MQPPLPGAAIHSSHSDGQWRLPSEMVLQDYHSYNKVTEKCRWRISYSCIVSQHDAPGIAESPRSDEVISSLIFASLLNSNEQDYEANFKADYEQAKVYDDAELMKIFEDYGEIDATVLVRLKDGVNMANITINLLPNSL
ncbi:hypothetical protein CS542_06190 [Pedobacter sp. IW39]|nr:hypothetical protein CS542_06190 [Pedobacter sp. IW39]